jgi:hypothetical protein
MRVYIVLFVAPSSVRLTNNRTTCIHFRTVFPDANATVRLEFGEFLIHPGNLVHGGVDITHGSRYLMIIFTHTTETSQH